jgi:hypothetical protein
MPIRERVRIFHVKIEALESEINNFLANSEEIDDLVDVKIIETGNNTTLTLVIYTKKDEGAFSFG